MNRDKLIIVGTGRSGTNHFAKVCQDLGLDVGHEEWHPGGISSWCLVSDLPTSPYGPARSDLPVDECAIGHQLRDPVKTIPSLMTMNKSSWAFITADARSRSEMAWWNKAPLRVKAMWHWLDWNQRADRMSDLHWTLDTAADMGPGLAEALGMEELAGQWKPHWDAARSPTNNAQSRITGFRRLLNTSPPVAYRRWLHANGRLPATEEALFDADAKLAQDVMDFWQDYRNRLASGGGE